MDAAADAAIAANQEKAKEIKRELQRASDGDFQGVIQEQAHLLADVELAAMSPEGCVADSEAARCLLAAVTRAPRLPPPNAVRSRFEAAAAPGVGIGRLGRIWEKDGYCWRARAVCGISRSCGFRLRAHHRQPRIR